MTKKHIGWGAGNGHAPVADQSLIDRAQAVLGPGQTLGDLFVKPSLEAQAFLRRLEPRARAALENAARTM